MKIAIVGSGISGLSSAWLLRHQHEIVLLEKNDRPGGHSCTVDAPDGSKTVPVDVGFIVYNERNYPHLTGLFRYLGVATEQSDMSFAVSLKNGKFEWCGASARAVFAQNRNIFRLKFWRFLNDIRRFNKEATRWLKEDRDRAQTLGNWLEERQFDKTIARFYLMPMASSIWSATSRDVRDFSADTFLKFFDNHGLLTVTQQPRWRTVSGGSRQYVRKMAEDLGRCLVTGAVVRRVERSDDGVRLQVEGQGELVADQVIFASHADEVISMTTDLAQDESELLSGFPFQENLACLHQDPHLMPKRRAAWASWNALDVKEDQPAMVTYWMNRLQNLTTQKPLFVTLNPTEKPRDLIEEFRFSHPVFDHDTAARQEKLQKIQGRDRYWWTGAWLGNGFHEDGLLSSVRVAKALDAPIPWEGTSSPSFISDLKAIS